LKIMQVSLVEYPPDRNCFISDKARLNAIKKLKKKIDELRVEEERLSDLVKYYEGDNQ